jgi:MarR family transcriptional regulator, transcriptional regulator for hemolysin
MTAFNSELNIGYVLYDAARLVGKRYDQKARLLGLTRAQCQVLLYLDRHEGINQARLAEYLEIEPISIARLIDRMEQAGWVERRFDPADRRARLLFKTEKAKPIFEEVLRVGQETRAEALAGMSAADRERLHELLLRVRGNLSEKGIAAAEAGALLEGAK